MKEELLEAILVYSLVLLGLVLFSALGLTIIDSIIGVSCLEKAEVMSVGYDYSFFGGCMVEDQESGKYIPIENYRIK